MKCPSSCPPPQPGGICSCVGRACVLFVCSFYHLHMQAGDDGVRLSDDDRREHAQHTAPHQRKEKECCYSLTRLSATARHLRVSGTRVRSEGPHGTAPCALDYLPVYRGLTVILSSSSVSSPVLSSCTALNGHPAASPKHSSATGTSMMYSICVGFFDERDRMR